MLRESIKIKLTWTQEAMQVFVGSEARGQIVGNSKMYALEKARARANEVGTEPPPAADQLDQDLLLPKAQMRNFGGSEARARIWDTAASKGMTQIATAIGEEVKGPKSRISTGGGVQHSSRWFAEELPFGTVMHIGLENTSDTIAAGQERKG